uniref:Uncharacterized protein n=1 Tax=Eutreptiella gymnastica TaxID=73025 RepID=A0A7S4LBP8_9EUGL
MAHMSHVQAPMPPSLPQDGAASVPFLGQLDPEVATKLERVVASSILRTLGDAEVRALASMAKATVMQLLEAFAQRVSNREFDTEKDQRAYFVYGLQDLADRKDLDVNLTSELREELDGVSRCFRLYPTEVFHVAQLIRRIHKRKALMLLEDLQTEDAHKRNPVKYLLGVLWEWTPEGKEDKRKRESQSDEKMQTQWRQPDSARPDSGQSNAWNHRDTAFKPNHGTQHGKWGWDQGSRPIARSSYNPGNSDGTPHGHSRNFSHADAHRSPHKSTERFNKRRRERSFSRSRSRSWSPTEHCKRRRRSRSQSRSRRRSRSRSRSRRSSGRRSRSRSHRR